MMILFLVYIQHIQYLSSCRQCTSTYAGSGIGRGVVLVVWWSGIDGSRGGIGVYFCNEASLCNGNNDIFFHLIGLRIIWKNARGNTVDFHWCRFIPKRTPNGLIKAWNVKTWKEKKGTKFSVFFLVFFVCFFSSTHAIIHRRGRAGDDSVKNVKLSSWR